MRHLRDGTAEGGCGVVCVCLYIYMCVCVCIYIYICVCVYIYLCVYMDVNTGVCLLTSVDILHVCMNLSPIFLQCHSCD